MLNLICMLSLITTHVWPPTLCASQRSFKSLRAPERRRGLTQLNKISLAGFSPSSSALHTVDDSRSYLQPNKSPLTQGILARCRNGAAAIETRAARLRPPEGNVEELWAPVDVSCSRTHEWTRKLHKVKIK